MWIGRGIHLGWAKVSFENILSCLMPSAFTSALPNFPFETRGEVGNRKRVKIIFT